MTSTITHELKSIMGELSKAQRKSAEYMISNIADSAALTVQQLARKIGTSSMTLLRLAKQLGYSGYPDFQNRFKEILRSNFNNTIGVHEVLVYGENNPLLQRCAENHIYNINVTLRQLSNDMLDRVIDSIHTASAIYCVASGSSVPIASHLNSGLNRLLGNSSLASTDQDNIPEIIRRLRPTDVIIAISFPRYRRRTIEFLQMAKHYQSQIIALTDSELSPLAQFADELLPIQSQSVSDLDCPAAVMVVLDYILSAVANKNSDATNANLDKLEDIMSEWHSRF